MAERSEERTRDRSPAVDLDALTEYDGIDGDEQVERTSTGRMATLRRKVGSVFSFRGSVGSLFSLRSFLVAFVATVVGAVAFGMVIPFFGSVASLGGIFTAAFVFGALSSRRRYLEFGLAGAATAALGTLLEFLVIALVGDGGLLAVFGAGSGLVAALVGHYFGRDLRGGMTRDI